MGDLEMIFGPAGFSSRRFIAADTGFLFLRKKFYKCVPFM